MTYQLMLFPGFRDKAVTLSYDDGTRHDLRLIEIMQKHGLKVRSISTAAFLPARAKSTPTS